MSNRVKVYSDIFRDAAQIFFASVVVGPIIGGDPNPFVLLIGLAFSFVLWYYSIILVKN